MALGFNNPAVDFNHAGVLLANNSGARVAQGMAAGLDSLIMGVQQRAAQRQQKEREKKMRDDLAPLVEQMSGGQISIKDVSPEALPLLWGEAQRMEEQRAAQAQQAQMVEALNGLVGSGPITAERAAGMVSAGVKPDVVKMLVEMTQPKEPQWQPTAVDVGGATMLMTSPQSAVPMRPEKPEADPAAFQPRVIDQGGVKLYESAPGKFEQVRVGREASADPMVQMQAQRLRDQIARKQQEMLANQQAMAKGDKKETLWWGDRRDAEMRQMLELQQLQEQLQRLEQGGAAQSAPTAPAAPAGAPAAPAAPAAAPAGPTYEQRREGFLSRLRSK